MWITNRFAEVGRSRNTTEIECNADALVGAGAEAAGAASAARFDHCYGTLCFIKRQP